MFENVFAPYRKPFAAEMRGLGGFVPSDIPQSEADALIALYRATGGGAWTVNTNWLIDPVVGNWHGVTVAGGHVTQIGLYDNNLIGEVGDIMLPLTSMLVIVFGINQLSGTINVATLVVATRLAFYQNQLSGISGISSIYEINNLELQQNNFNQAGVDDVLSNCYSAFPSRTGIGGTVNVSGNTAPSGTHQAQCPPLTGKENAYELVNDSCGVSPNHWSSVTFDA